MSKNALYALLTEDSLSHFQAITRQSPIQMLAIPALYIGNTDESIEPLIEASYSATPKTFSLERNPFTGNTSLVLLLGDPSPALYARAQQLGGDLSPCIFVSDAVHAIPRNYRSFLNSLEETFMREKLEYEFHAEFVVEHS